MDRGLSAAPVSLMVIAAVVGFAALDLMQPIAAPAALALVVGVVLSPVAGLWERIGLKPVIGALITVFVTLAVLIALTFLLQPIVVQMVEQAPKVWADLAGTFANIRRLLSGLSDLTSEVTAAMSPDAPAAAAPAMDVTLPNLGTALMMAPALAGQVLVFIGVLFFFLYTRVSIYHWAARHLSEPTQRADTARKLLEAERLVSRYFLAVTLINLGLGLVTGLVFQVLGLPAAALWGVLVMVANFIVYVGPATVALLLLFAGVASFDGVLVLLPATLFVVLNGIEGQFITPSLVGMQVEVNPLLIFLALIFGIWLWGPIGGIVAIPLLIWVLVVNNRLGSNAPQSAPGP